MSSLEKALAALATEGDGFAIEAPEAWAQGRTLYGGITAALAYTAATRAVAVAAPLQSAQLAFVGPASGRLRFAATVLRQGRSTTAIGVDAQNEAGLAARATFVFASPRDSSIAHDYARAMPAPPAEACEPFFPMGEGLPAFLGRFEFRLASGSRLLQGDAKPEFAVWVRLREGDAADPVATLLAIADATPGAALVQYPGLAPVSTVTWQIDLHQPLPRAGGWRLLWSSSERAAGGYSVQAMRLWDRDGTALASARQMVALFA